MKKFIVFVMAAVAVMNFSSCNNEMDMLDPIAKSKEVGYININTTTSVDNVADTRSVNTDANGVTTINGSDLNTWLARVYNGTTYKWGANGFTTIDNVALGAVGLDASKTWTVEVRNYADMASANASNSPYGNAYYEGKNDAVTVTAGSSTDVTVDCGTPKNSLLNITKTGFTGSNLKVYITSPRTVSFTANPFENNGKAYFAPGTVKLYITYDFGGATDRRWPTGEGTYDISLSAGYQKTLNFTMNTNGTITLKITTSDFEDGGSTAITFDAMTGDAPNPTNS